MNELILFDLDGTLTDSSEGITKSVVYALKQFGIDEKPENCLRFVGPPLGPELHKVYGIDPDKGVLAFREYFEKQGIYENKLYPNTLETLKKLKENGHTLCVATSKPEVMARRVIAHFGLDKYIEKVYGASLDEKKSAKADIIQEALDDHPGMSAVMVGDRMHDIIGAKKCGIFSIGIPSGFGEPDELEKAGADIVLRDISQLATIDG